MRRFRLDRPWSAAWAMVGMNAQRPAWVLPGAAAKTPRRRIFVRV